MPNPSPIYVVSYAGTQLPGYVQSDDRPLSFRNNVDTMFGRDGGIITPSGASMRDISLTFLVKSSLGTGATGLEHLDNVMDQYRAAVAAVSRPRGENPLVIHDSDRYYLAAVDSISMPMNAQQSRSINYTVSFVAQPWALSVIPQAGSFSGNGTVNITGMTGSRHTYPEFAIPNTVAAFTATDAHGHTLAFNRGVFTTHLTVDCATLLVYRTSTGENRITTMDNLNFGLRYDPTEGDTFPITITGWSGSGTVDVSVPKRYEV